ncbi:hypothetical protein PR202_ga10250 [Eleusine coracana subsp. coracana]|uniref:Uncharacterized protein n=1 Tax=Eleusine coracana subsp. coracana TaxID=191504 RepID=A0AAV5C667_ELECO|nr:hypothetical protein PR202_ga10250 [Eleusine coracana subsp. coracana]
MALVEAKPAGESSTSTVSAPHLFLVVIDGVESTIREGTLHGNIGTVTVTGPGQLSAQGLRSVLVRGDGGGSVRFTLCGDAAAEAVDSSSFDRCGSVRVDGAREVSVSRCHAAEVERAGRVSVERCREARLQGGGVLRAARCRRAEVESFGGAPGAVQGRARRLVRRRRGRAVQGGGRGMFDGSLLSMTLLVNSSVNFFPTSTEYRFLVLFGLVGLEGTKE